MTEHEYLESVLFSYPNGRKLLKRYRPTFKNYRKKLCKQCMGRCCKYCGCHFSPSDFKSLTYGSLKTQISKGHISIASIPSELAYGHPPLGTLYLRIRNKNSPIVDTCISCEPSECILLSDSGCMLPKRKRPTGGTALIPIFKDGLFICHQYYDIKKCSYEWQLYQKTLYDLLDFFQNKSTDYPCKLI